jgi:hypothetical protein
MLFKKKNKADKKGVDSLPPPLPPPPFSKVKLPVPLAASSPFGDDDEDDDDDQEPEGDDVWGRASQGSAVFEARLQLFYAMHEPDKKQSAIDSIVSWTESNGVTMLNKMLKKRYGADLESFERDRTLSAKMPRNNFTAGAAAAASSAAVAPSFQEERVGGGMGGGGGSKESASIQQQQQLQLKSPSPRPSGTTRRPSKTKRDKDGKPRKHHRNHNGGSGTPALGTTGTTAGGELSAAPRRRGTGHTNHAQTFSVQIAAKPLSGAKQNLMQVLQMYYIKHDVKKLEPEVFNAITGWAERHGVRRLNRKLLKKYGEDLRMFRAENIKRDNLLVLLKQFYSRYEPDKPASELDTILKWALENGTTSLNEKLKAKYGEDLNDAVEALLAKSKRKDKRSSRRGSDKEKRSSRRGSDTGGGDEATRKSGCKMFEPDESSGLCICGEAQKDHARSALRRAHGLTVRLQQRLDAADVVRRSMVRPGAPVAVVKACDSYELDLSERGFGFCKCGAPLSSHKIGVSKPKGGRVARGIPMEKL